MIKQIFDFMVLSIVIVIFLPVIMLISFVVRKKLGTPVFFNQLRPGLNNKCFYIHKFRTMTDDCDDKGVLLSDDLRLTNFGKFLRSTSLDELPAIYNVVKCEMSLVGPRPLLIQYLDRYTPEQARRHDVKPGITGWAQVNGRNSISWEEKFKLDVWYVDNQSIFIDIKIILMTVLKVIKRDGISEDGHATAQEFMGTDFE